MKYWKIQSFFTLFTYEFETDDTVTKNEIKEWFKSTYSSKICNIKEVDKDEINSEWLIPLKRKGDNLVMRW